MRSLPISKTAPFYLAFALTFGVLQAWMGLHLSDIEPPFIEPPIESAGKFNPDLFRLFTFGNVPVAVDWLWISALVDPAISRVPPGTHAPAYYNFDLLTDLDPEFLESYTSGGNLLAVIRGDATGARDLLLKGEDFRRHQLENYPVEFIRRFWSNEWRVPILLAYVQLFEIGDMPAASKAFTEASQISGAPGYLAHLAQQLAAPNGQYEVGLRLLKFLGSASHDPRAKKEFQEKFESLKVGRYLHEVRLKYAEFLKKSGRSSEEKAWRAFLAATGQPEHDEWGGRLKLDEKGTVITETPHLRVMGLD